MFIPLRQSLRRSSKACAVAIASLCLGGILIGAMGSQDKLRYQDNFNDRNADGWTEYDPFAGAFGPATFKVVRRRYEMTSPVLPPLNLTYATGSFWDVSATGLFDNGFFSATVKMNTAATNVSILLRSDDVASKGYGFFLNNHENFVGISDLASGNPNLDGMRFPLVEDVEYLIVGSAVGPNLSITVQ